MTKKTAKAKQAVSAARAAFGNQTAGGPKAEYDNSPAIPMGELTLKPEGFYQGRFVTPNDQTPIIVYPNPNKTKDNHPDFLIETDTGFQFGRGYINIGTQSKKEYIRLSFKAPNMPDTYCNIARHPDDKSESPTEFVLLANN